MKLRDGGLAIQIARERTIAVDRNARVLRFASRVRIQHVMKKIPPDDVEPSSAAVLRRRIRQARVNMRCVEFCAGRRVDRTVSQNLVPDFVAHRAGVAWELTVLVTQAAANFLNRLAAACARFYEIAIGFDGLVADLAVINAQRSHVEVCPDAG